MHKVDQELIDKAIEAIKSDVAEGDFTAIEELLKTLSTEALIAFLPELG